MENQMAGANSKEKTDFKLDATLMGLNVAIVNAGSFIAGPFSGPMVDYFGRRYGLMIGSFISLIGVIIQICAPNEAAFVAGRFFLGFSFTIIGSTAPMWLTEVAHPKYRGLLVNASIPMLPFFGTIASIITLGIYQSHGNWPWRGSLMALDILAHLHGNGDRNNEVVQLEFQEISETLNYEREHEGSWKSLISPAPDFRRFLITVLINIFFQICSSNILPYFLTIILTQAGIEDMRTILLTNLGLCLWGLLATCTGIFAIDRIGRKTFLLYSTMLMTLCLFALGACTKYIGQGMSYTIGAVAMVFLFQFPSFASWMLLTYTYPPEILKYSQRAKGIAVGQAIGYGFACMMTYTLPIALENIGWRFYIINGSWNVLIIIAIWWLFVETKGKTLEEVDSLFEGVHFDVIEGVDTKKVANIEETELPTKKE